MMENMNINPDKNIEKSMTISFSEKEAEIIISNLSLQSQEDHSKEFSIQFEKEPIDLEKSKTYAQYAVFDKETDKMLSLAKELEQYKDLPEKEKLAKILDILRKNVQYPYKKDIENLKIANSDLAEWVEKNNMLSSGWSPINLSDTFEKGYGICGNLSLAYLYLVEKAGLKGVILSGDEIVNINRADNNKPLFKLVDVGQRAPDHFWCEIELSNGEWMPVDPSTKLIGDEKGIEDFKKANYIGRPKTLPAEIDINAGLNCPIKINFLPGEKYGEALCEVKKTTPINLSKVKKDFVPYNGECKLHITISPEREIDLKIKIKNVHELEK